MIVAEEQQHNLYAYHEVFADSLKVINDLKKEGREKEAKQYIISNTIYAMTLNLRRELTKEEIEALETMEYSLLFSKMVHEQSKAGLIPFQQFRGRSVFQEARRKYEEIQGMK